MLLGVIADTHDNVEAIEAATNQFEARGVETIVHCGDMIAPPAVSPFDGFTLHAVLGNNDGEIGGLRNAIDALSPESRLHGRFGVLSFDDTTVAVTHGERMEAVEAVAASGHFDYVCYGHHHEPDCRTIDGTTILNPGAHFPSIPRANQSTAVIDTETDEVAFVAVV